MKRTLIVNIHGEVPFDDVMLAEFEALSPDSQTQKLHELERSAAALLADNSDDGAVVTAEVYVKEDAE
ncbi:hypothetical protein G5B47_02225 [Paenibacillus sp. 7124]|uniref:Uncharacterized protein n=1 Tax=Paenibacillus apii TaxID=1850370 RepID=A0A6M1PF89_9BACL|nr:hypothetical protein [Paenibacillus apii]NGM81224.1 hypothetical protein [Paenibacillus apii]